LPPGTLSATLPGTDQADDGRLARDLGRDKAYDTADFVEALRDIQVTPHVAQNTTKRSSMIDRRTTRHAGYEVSQRKRKRVEEIFADEGPSESSARSNSGGGSSSILSSDFGLTVYNLVRIRNLTAEMAR